MGDGVGAVFAALADPSRRTIVERLAASGRATSTELAGELPMTRQAVAKHLAILEAANLVSVHWQGREKLHYLNPVPIGDIVRRWVGKFEDARVESLTGLKAELEEKERRNVRT